MKVHSNHTVESRLLLPAQHPLWAAQIETLAVIQFNLLVMVVIPTNGVGVLLGVIRVNSQ
jgi:hypothetical protein